MKKNKPKLKHRHKNAPKKKMQFIIAPKVPKDIVDYYEARGYGGHATSERAGGW